MSLSLSLSFSCLFVSLCLQAAEAALEAEKKKQPWNVDTLSKPGFDHSSINKSKSKWEQEREARYQGLRRARERDHMVGSYGSLTGRKQHGTRRRISHESSSEYEEVRRRTDTSTSAEITKDIRQSMQHPPPPGYQDPRTPDVSPKFQDTNDPP